MNSLLICTLLILAGCGSLRGPKGDNGVGSQGQTGQDGASCQLNSEGYLSCPDGSSFKIPEGKAGVDGSSCTVEPNSVGSTITCPDGSTSVVVNGTNGTNGTDGTSGTDGAAGTNGTNGNNGTDGVDATPITLVPFCPSIAGAFPEFGMCIGNQLIAVYDGPTNSDVRLVKLTPGNYQTTDGRACTFTLVSGCTIQ